MKKLLASILALSLLAQSHLAQAQSPVIAAQSAAATAGNGLLEMYCPVYYYGYFNNQHWYVAWCCANCTYVYKGAAEFHRTGGMCINGYGCDCVDPLWYPSSSLSASKLEPIPEQEFPVATVNHVPAPEVLEAHRGSTAEQPFDLRVRSREYVLQGDKWVPLKDGVGRFGYPQNSPRYNAKLDVAERNDVVHSSNSTRLVRDQEVVLRDVIDAQSGLVREVPVRLVHLQMTEEYLARLPEGQRDLFQADGVTNLRVGIELLPEDYADLRDNLKVELPVIDDSQDQLAAGPDSGRIQRFKSPESESARTGHLVVKDEEGHSYMVITAEEFFAITR